MKEFIVNLFKNIKEFWKAYKKKLLIPILELLGLIIVCVVLVRLIGGHETLSDYAAKHPDIAYSASTANDTSATE